MWTIYMHNFTFEQWSIQFFPLKTSLTDKDCFLKNKTEIAKRQRP